MPFDKILTDAFERYGLLGLVVAASSILVVLGTVFVLKRSGFTAFGDKSKLVDDAKIDGVARDVKDIKETLGDQISRVERRVTAVERDVQDRPTKTEIHNLQLALARMEGRFDLTESAVRATGASVTRMEDFLLRISERDRAK